MAYTKKLASKNVDNKTRAVEAHSGFVSFVVGKVNKVGIETVLKQYQPSFGPPTEFNWLRKAYERVLNFSEQVQLKQMPQKLAGDDESAPIRVIFRAAPDSAQPKAR